MTRSGGAMFESDGGGREVNLGRRLFLSGLGAAVGGAALLSLRRPQVIAEAAKTEPEWRKQLPSGVFEITRHADTELAYSGKLLNVHDSGIFRCICCDNALFSSSTKFDSGTGWPSFWEPIAKEKVREIHDRTLGMERGAGASTG